MEPYNPEAPAIRPHWGSPQRGGHQRGGHHQGGYHPAPPRQRDLVSVPTEPEPSMQAKEGEGGFLYGKFASIHPPYWVGFMWLMGWVHIFRSCPFTPVVHICHVMLSSYLSFSLPFHHLSASSAFHVFWPLSFHSVFTHVLPVSFCLQLCPTYLIFMPVTPLRSQNLFQNYLVS